MTEQPIVHEHSPILAETPDEPEPELTEEEQLLKQKIEKAQKCKVIALHRMGHHPILANISRFNQKSKLQVLEIVKELFENPDEEIQNEFNKVCSEVVFDAKQDYTAYPIYNTNYKAPITGLEEKMIAETEE